MVGGRGESSGFLTLGSRRRKLALLLACWLCGGIFCAAFWCLESRLVVPPVGVADELAKLRLPPNEMGAFSVRRFDANAAHRPVFCVGWKNVRTANGRLGILRTPLHKTATVEDLQLRLYRYSPDENPRNGQTGGFHSPAAAPGLQAPAQSDAPEGDLASSLYTIFADTLAALEHELKNRLEGATIDSPLLMDMSNTSEVVVRNLDCRYFGDGELELGIKCSMAVLSGSEPVVTLRGCVTIEAANDCRMMSGRVIWNLEKNRFVVPGTYVLGREGTLLRGRGIQCDHRLNPLVAHETLSRKGARQWVEGASF